MFKEHTILQIKRNKYTEEEMYEVFKNDKPYGYIYFGHCEWGSHLIKQKSVKDWVFTQFTYGDSMNSEELTEILLFIKGLEKEK